MSGSRYVDGLLETVIIFSFFLVHVQYCLVPRTVPFFLFEPRFRDSQTPNAMLNPPKKYQRIPTSRSVRALKAAPRRTSPRTYAQCQLFNHPNRNNNPAHHPSGRYRRTIRGIFFWFNSFMAICRGSVSPSRSTSTGAFMLHGTYVSQSDFMPHSGFDDIATHLICRARVPSTRARSYLVKYGVVVRCALGTFFSRDCSINLPEYPELGSPETTTFSPLTAGW